MSLRTCTYIAEKLIIETEKKKSEYVPEERENIGIKRKDLREWITKREWCSICDWLLIMCKKTELSKDQPEK